MGLDAYVGNIGFVGFPDDYATPEGWREALAEGNAEDALVREVVGRGGCPADWPVRGEEDPELIERVGPYASLHCLRRYACHLEANGRPPELPATPDDPDDPEVADVMARIADFYGDWDAGAEPPPTAPPPSRFIHLLWHSDADGYYVPADFPHPCFVTWQEQDVSIGSAPRLLAELDVLNEWLCVSHDLGELSDDDRRAWEESLSEDEWAVEKWVWSVLHWLARVSVQRRQSLVFG